MASHFPDIHSPFAKRSKNVDRERQLMHQWVCVVCLAGECDSTIRTRKSKDFRAVVERASASGQPAVGYKNKFFAIAYRTNPCCCDSHLHLLLRLDVFAAAGRSWESNPHLPL